MKVKEAARVCSERGWSVDADWADGDGTEWVVRIIPGNVPVGAFEREEATIGCGIASSFKQALTEAVEQAQEQT